LSASTPKQRNGKRRELSPVGQIGEGPAMSALNERQKLFVRALFEAPRNHGSHAFAARAAGYGTETSSNNSIASIAYQVACDPKVQTAIAEMSQQYVTTLGPVAVRALKKVLDTPTHRDFGRAIGLVIERVSPQQSTHTVKVEGEVKLSSRETADVLERIEQLASKFMVRLPAPKIIDHEGVA
jgi:phage terminase small subunit